MLVLAREIGEDLIIDVPGWEPIVVKLIDIRTSMKVRIGVHADSRIVVHRREVWEANYRGGLPPITEDYDAKPPVRSVNDKREGD